MAPALAFGSGIDPHSVLSKLADRLAGAVLDVCIRSGARDRSSKGRDAEGGSVQ